MSDKELEKAVNTESAENTEEKTSRNFIEQMIDKDPVSYTHLVLSGRRVFRLGVDVIRPAGGKAGFSIIFPVLFPGDAKKLQIRKHGRCV